MDKKDVMPVMCNWCIEENEGWFVAYSIDLLYKYDMQKKEMTPVSAVPTTKIGSYQHPLCVKYEDLIYCIPYYAETIWCYNSRSNQWNEISLCNDKSVPMVTCLLGSYHNVFYFFSMNLKKIYGLDLKTGTLKFEYIVNINDERDTFERFDGILVNGCAYLVLGGRVIYEFNLDTREQIKHELSSIDDTLYKISFCGKFFWLLGKKKEVYIWSKESNTTVTIRNLPETFLLYDFIKKVEIVDLDNGGEDLIAFSGICCLNDKVWLIPQSGNKILYCSQDKRKFNIFEIQDEEETAETLDLNYRHLAMKFFMMYVREERFLGIYSYKNKRMFEIDTLNMSYQNMDILVDKEDLSKMEIYNFYEDGDEFTYLVYVIKMEESWVKLRNQERMSAGERIYRETIK